MQALLEHDSLSPEEQRTVLQKIQHAMNDLQKDYRDARDKHNLERRRHGNLQPFDEDKEIEGR